MRARLSGDGGAFSVELADGVFRVTAEDPGDAGLAKAAESRVATAIRFDYSPAQGTATAFAARVASDFLGVDIVEHSPAVGELEQAEIGKGSRAFCPGASPPDNSCSPSNKGDKAPSEAAGWMDRLRKHQQHFDGSRLTRPAMIMGMPEMHVDPIKFSEYLESAGQEWQASSLPPGFTRGAMGECYRNATLLVLSDPNLDYCEGIAYPAGGIGFGFLHGWAVDRKTGRVIDNTWDRPQDCKYVGVRYDRKKYMRHVAKTGYYGVFGGDSKKAAAVLKRGGL